MSLNSVIFIHPAVTIQASHSVKASIAVSFHILPNSLFTNPITRLFKAWDTDLLSSLAYGYGPYSLNSLCFSMTAHRGLSSAFLFYLFTPIDFRHSSYSPTTLILVFLLFFFHLVSPEILSLRSYHRTFLPDDQHFLVFIKLFLLLQYLAFFLHNLQFVISSDSAAVLIFTGSYILRYV
jgi:hypothetical protein